MEQSIVTARLRERRWHTIRRSPVILTRYRSGPPRCALAVTVTSTTNATFAVLSDGESLELKRQNRGCRNYRVQNEDGLWWLTRPPGPK
jgi:hypothetical protein